MELSNNAQEREASEYNFIVKALLDATLPSTWQASFHAFIDVALIELLVIAGFSTNRPLLGSNIRDILL